MDDCKRFGFHTPEDINWYINQSENVEDVLTDKAELIKLDLKSVILQCSDQQVDHQELCVLEEYWSKTTLAMKIFFKVITKDNTWISGAPETHVWRELRKIRKITSDCIYHSIICNSIYMGPLQTLYVKHTNRNYMYNA